MSTTESVQPVIDREEQMRRAEKLSRAASWRSFFKTGLLHVVLVSICVVLCVPFLWMLLTSFKTLDDVGKDNWIPVNGEFQWVNYVDVFDTRLQVDVIGKVTDMAEDGTSLTVLEPNGLETPIQIDRKVKFERDGKPLELSRVRVGEDVHVTRPSGEGIPFGRFYWNSVFVACWVTFLQVLTSAMAAFSFSRLKWPGRDKVFMLYLGTMMLPGLTMMIPKYQIMIKLGLVDTYSGLIIPAAFSAFGTFLLRQFMLTIPSSLDEAAEIDGASKWQVFWDVILPLARPGLVTLTIFTFLGNYRSLFWPLVMLKSQAKYTLPMGMLFFDSTRGQVTNLLMAAITMSIVPMVVVFVFFQKQLVKGIQLGAVKG